MRNKIVVLLALLAVTGFAAAGAFTVKQRTEAASLHAERFNVGEMFVFEASAISPVIAGADAAGVVGAPVEMTAAFPVARTALTRDHWQYSVRIQETSVASALEGQYLVELQVDGATVATPVVIGQASAQASVLEGVVAVFDLGDTILPSSLYYVTVKKYTPPATVVSYALDTGYEGSDNRWIGVGGSIDNIFNPSLSVALGNAVAITITNADDKDVSGHNIGVKDAAGTRVAGWAPATGYVDAVGETATLSWTPSAAGTYTYLCQLHPTQMTGTITVA